MPAHTPTGDRIAVAVTLRLVSAACMASMNALIKLAEGVGVFGNCGQLAMTSSLKHGPVSVVVPMDYSSLIWATLYGWLLFAALPEPATWLGAPVIVASGLYIVLRENRLRRNGATRAAA